MMVRWSGDVQVNVSKMSVNVKSQSELDIGGRETCLFDFGLGLGTWTRACQYLREIRCGYGT